MHGDLSGVNRNWGSCTGPMCHMYTMRCANDMCQTCCNRIHGHWTIHGRPWAGTNLEVKPDPRLPAVYQPKALGPGEVTPVNPPAPKLPEPMDLEETTDDALGDWTLAAEKTYTTTYYT